jgi:hypothetical protein
MRFGDGGGDGQAEAGSARLICPVRAEALEGLEQPLDLPGGDRGAGVGHEQERVPVSCSCRDLDLAAGDVVGQGVVGEVGYQPLGEAGVACGRGGAELGSDAQCQGLCPRATRLEYARCDFGEVEGVAVVQAALAAGQGEQRLDQQPAQCQRRYRRET